MTEKMKIKIIKKSQAMESAVQPDPVKAKRVAAREMVSTVSDWVSEFKSRKSEETKAAIDQLFAKNPQPNES